MSKLVESIRFLEDNLKKLIYEHQDLKVKYRTLSTQFNSENNSISELNSKIEMLQKENKTLRTANAMLGSTEYKRETKLKINSLIKEIDSCIIQLAE
jgi:chromosome segregation ATPase